LSIKPKKRSREPREAAGGGRKAAEEALETRRSDHERHARLRAATENWSAPCTSCGDALTRQTKLDLRKPKRLAQVRSGGATAGGSAHGNKPAT